MNARHYATAAIGAGCFAAWTFESPAAVFAVILAAPLVVFLASLWDDAAREAEAAGALKRGQEEREP